MDRKYLIGAILVIIVIIIGCAVYFGQSHVERADDELVVAAYSHGGEPESGFDPIRLELLFRTFNTKYFIKNEQKYEL